jgi:hypothetical protein
VGVLSLVLLGTLSFAAVQDPAAAPPPHAPDQILFLTPSRPNGLEVRPLVDAVTTYTHDLGLSVKTVEDDTGAPVPADVERLAALVRARRALVAIWCVPSTDGSAAVDLYAAFASGTVRREVVHLTGPQGPEFDRAMALKVRAMLAPEGSAEARVRARPPAAAADKGEAVEAAPASGPAGEGSARAPAPAAAPAPGGTGGVTEPRPPAPVPVSSIATRPAAPVVRHPPPETAVVAAGLAYFLSIPSGQAPTRQGVLVQGLGRLGAHAELFLSAGLGLAETANTATGSLSLYDVPLRLGGRYLHRTASATLAGGLFGAVHVLSASATAPGGASADTLTAAGGAGLDALARGGLFGPLAWELRAWFEATVPRTRFLVGGTPAVETGRWAGGLSFGVVFPTR